MGNGISTVLESLDSSALFFSDTHALYGRNGASNYHLQMIFASCAPSIYGVGDVFDLEAVDMALGCLGLKPDQYPQDVSKMLELINFPNLEHQLRVYDALVCKAAMGVQVTLLTGNHDLALDLLDGEVVHGIYIKKNDVYAGSDGRKYGVEHGHLSDPAFLQNFQGLYSVGCYALDAGLWADDKLTQIFPAVGHQFPVTNTIKMAGKPHIKNFASKLMGKARDEGLDGIICGHIHKQEKVDALRHTFLRYVINEGANYINCGDGLTHGTSVLHSGGEWHLLNPDDIPETASIVLESTTSLDQYRPRTIALLQKIWDAHLETKLSKSSNAFGYHSVSNNNNADLVTDNAPAAA